MKAALIGGGLGSGWRLALASLCSIALVYLCLHTISVQAAPAAPGYGSLGYALPAPGSYQLPAIRPAADGEVLDEQGQTESLHQLLRGKYTLLSFIYSNCQDTNGCPLSSYVLYKIKAALQDQPELADKLQLVSLSFDPERDTPEVMRLYAKNYQYAGPKGVWRFLTTASEQALAPILSDYRQDIQREIAINGKPGTEYAHILRVFLIDPELQIRNIYSVSFLHPDLLLTDVRTLLLEDSLKTASQSDGKPDPDTTTVTVASRLSVPGDNKQGYEQSSYQTRAKALVTRTGEAANLLAIAQHPPLGLPPLPDEGQTLTTGKIALGRKLFFDRRLSLNDTFSCAMCHIPEQGFTNNELATSIGVEGRSGRRNAPSLYNVAYAKHLFHDGRDNRLEEQIWAPLLANNEMANPSVGYVLNKIRQIPDYRNAFETVFQEPVSMQHLGDALAAYQRTLLAADSAFDRWYYGKQTDAMSAEAIMGFRLFTGKANCASCHALTADSALFTDQKLHNTGIGYRESMGIRPPKQRVALAPGVFVDVDQSILDSVGAKPLKDLGLYEITQNPADRWKYKTPSLRNIALTAPYMHNGSLASLPEVIAFYNQGGIANPNLSPLLQPLGLNNQEVGYLLAFLQSLTGSNVDVLVADAFAAPVGDLTRADPNWANQQTEALTGEAR